MKKLWLLMLVAVLISPSYQEDKPGKINWVLDYNEALNMAKEEGKPVWLYFGFKA